MAHRSSVEAAGIPLEPSTPLSVCCTSGMQAPLHAQCSSSAGPSLHKDSPLSFCQPGAGPLMCQPAPPGAAQSPPSQTSAICTSPVVHRNPCQVATDSVAMTPLHVVACRHSVVWSCICRSTRRLLVVKAYLKRKMRSRHHQNVRRELSILSKATADRFACSPCWRAWSEC